MKNSKQAFLRSMIALVLCVSMFVGTTFAWFTDEVVSMNNIIQTGILDVELDWYDESASAWKPVDQSTNVFDEGALWEPGYTDVVYLRVRNAGNLALKYQLGIRVASQSVGTNVYDEPLILSNYIHMGIVKDKTNETTFFASRDDARAELTTTNTLTSGKTVNGEMLKDEADEYFALVVYMPETVGNEANYKTGTTPPSINLGITLLATQMTAESDSFGPDYDTEATFPALKPGSVTVNVTPGTDNRLTGDVTITSESGHISAVVPAGTLLESGTTQLTFSVSNLSATQSNVVLQENEIMRSLDVHVEGVAAGNTTPVQIYVKEAMMPGLNMGNYALYHVENGATNEMTAGTLSAHNGFEYDPVTGDVKLSMASFSEIAVVADTTAAWEGNLAESFADGTGTEDDPYIIANADQLAYLGNVIANEPDSYGSKHYKLINNVDMGGAGVLDENGMLKFYPIGYTSDGYKGAFSGTFDGTGHIISNIFQNTWMLLGTYDGTYYNAAMGLFGYVYGGTVKNLTIDNFYSEGEFTPTGCVAAYAANATFENIAITSSHPQTYNTSVAAVVGRDGSNGANNNGGYNLIFKNITVDDTNTVSALWGSWDVGAAGLLGYLGSDSKVLFENCNVAATIDVYNDVCGNYQYYWYRYCGAYIGTVDKRLDNGKGALDLSNVTAKKCTVNFGDRHEYYYCEFEKNSIASYTDDFQFSRVDHSELNIDANPVTCKHVHTANEDKQAVYIPFRQLFGGYGWGVDGVDEYENIEISDYTNAQDKFETKFTGNFLYRVGNQNAVSIDSLFAAKDNMEINASGVYVTIDKVDENMNVSGSFTANTTDWTKGTIQLEGTGVVKVTIQDYNFCKPTELYLEVVDAKNITSANGSNGINVVLLQNIKVSANGTINYQSCTVYGNGFEIDVRGGMNQYNSKQGHGIIIAKNATLDHLSIVGDIYDEYGMYTTTLTGAAQNDYTAAVDAEHCIIQNCYIANCAAPVRSNGNTIIDTTLYGGTIANLLISGGSNTLTNVTTVNYNDGRGVVGMGIVITDGASADSTKLILNGYLKQYNFVYETDISAIKVTEAQTVFNSMFDNQFSAYHIGSNPKAVNTGIISINESINLDDAVLVDSANTGYLVSNDVTVTFYAQGFEKNVGAAVASVPAANNSVDNNYEKVAYSQGDYLPTFEFDLGDQMQAKDNDDDTRFLIGDKNGLSAMYPKGESALLLNLNTLAKWSKYTGISYTVTAKCITPSGEERTGTVTLDTKGTYTLVFTVKDDIFYNQNGQKINKSVTRTYEVPLVLDVYEKSIADATISIDSAGLTGEWGGYSGNWKYTMYPLDAIEQIMDDANKDGVAEPFDHKTNIESVVLDPASNNAFSAATTVTITYNNGQVLELVLGVPSGCSSPGASNGGKTLSASIDSNHGIKIVSDGKIANKCNGTWPITSWRFKGTSQKVVANSTTVTITFSAESSSGGGNTTCLAEGTLITLADGTKKAIEDLRKGDSVMAFDHLTGKVTNNDIIIVVKTQSDFYKNTFIFDDGSELVTINEHGIFDLDLNKYVNIDAVNYKQFIGHRFVAIGTTGKVGVKKLIDVTVEWTTGYKYDIVTNQTLNYVAEDTLSVTHVLVDVINTFDFGEDLKYSTTKMQSDIEKYGLYNYNEWDEYCDISVFEQYNIPVMKVGISKGLYTKEYIIGLINKYVLDDSVQIVG